MIVQRNQQLNFGKYKGKTLQNVIDLDPGYISWCLRAIDSFEVAEDVEQELKEQVFDYYPFGNPVDYAD